MPFFPVTAYQSQPATYPGRKEFEKSLARGPEGDDPVFLAAGECFRLAGLDAARYGTPSWNPLSGLIRPGETVLLKPNLIKESHPRDPEGWQYVITHGAVIRAAAEYVFRALEGTGRVIVADAPQTDSSFSAIRDLLGLDLLERHYRRRNLDFSLIDLRKEEWTSREGVVVSRRKLQGDPAGYIAYDLGPASEFRHHDGAGRYYGADYATGEVNRHHSDGRHEYLVAGSVIKADVVFSLPKLKTHKKAGITVALKNLIGINGDKNWLPHHTERDPESGGGDERPEADRSARIESALVGRVRKLTLAAPRVGPWIHRGAKRMGRRVFGDSEDVIRNGNWWGNDTVWRTCLDLNKILLYGNPDGTMREPGKRNRKRHYVLVDGIVAGQGRGPMNPDPFPAGLMVFGIHPPDVDAACAVLMGFDPERIPIIREAYRCESYPLVDWSWRDVPLASNRPEWNAALAGIESTFRFEPHFGWKGHIERQAAVGAGR
jgi:uncharacterized protein (DUF362 family)